MSEVSFCAECGARLPATWPKGLCPRCALQDALEIEGGERQVLHPINPAEAQQTVSLPKLTETSGTRIGRYKLLEQIGEGGFGVVWMAEQEEPVRRRVALKIIKLGMDTKQMIARFEAERQALALMDHPNIAKIFDAGVTGAPISGRRWSQDENEEEQEERISAGRPYFVMELVRGIKITDYCDQNKLSTPERLDLFIQACHAIQHAHQKGIIHRDIKPSNVLVTLHDGARVPKVIDFGIAKATEGRLTDKTLFTSFQQFIGTPAYVSPEQAEMSGLDIDTRSDIYSLGVLLYELLTGQTPFDSKELVNSGLDAIRRTLREVEPLRPSARLNTLGGVMLTATAQHHHTEPPRLISLIRGDLDWIVMKCLEKDRTRRYETANALAMDIERHLKNEPVVARPPSKLYRFERLVRRNKLAFAAAGAVGFVLVVGVVVSTWQAVRATRAEREQSRLRQDAVAARNNEAKLLAKAQADEKRAETEAARSAQVAQFLKEMLNGVEPSVARGRDATMLREILDKAAERITNDLKDQPEVEAELRSTMGEVYFAVGEFERALTMHRQAEALYRKLFGEEHPLIAISLSRQALALRWGRRTAEAETVQRAALAMERRLLGDENPEVATGLDNLALVLMDRHKLAEAESAASEALAVHRKLFGLDSPEAAVSLNNLGLVLRRRGALAAAEAAQREALGIRRKCFGDEHPDTAKSLNNLAQVLRDEAKLTEAEPISRESLALRRRMLGNDHPEVFASLHILIQVLQREEKLEEAVASQRELLELERKHFGSEHAEVAGLLNDLGLLLRQQGKLPEAEAAFVEELAIKRKIRGERDVTVQNSLNKVTEVLCEEGKATEAEELCRDVLRSVREGTAPDDPQATAMILASLTRVLLAAGKYAEAEPVARECLTIREKRLPSDWGAFNSQSMLGGALLGQERYAEAEPLLISGYQGLKKHESALLNARGKARLREALQRLVLLYQATGRTDQAAEWNNKLAEFDSEKK